MAGLRASGKIIGFGLAGRIASRPGSTVPQPASVVMLAALAILGVSIVGLVWLLRT
jgi:hypothetical protein